MAKTDKKAEAPATKVAAKEKQPGETREMLIAQGPKGIIKLLGLTAVKLAARNDYEGVMGFGANGKAVKAVKGNDGKETEDSAKARKAAANKVQPKWSEGGSLYKLVRNENSDEYKKLYSLAKGAAPDIEKQSYSQKVKDFLQYMTEGHGGGGTRSFNTAGLGGLL
jgi:hypothetical protein